jgi:hypothetical protein
MRTKQKETMLILFKVVLLISILVQFGCATMNQGADTAATFSYDQAALAKAKPWTDKKFQSDPNEFQFVIIGDRTGGANPQETFKLAMGQINLLQPEFVINVGDIIEGYSDDKTELNAEWDEIDTVINSLNMPFFRTPGAGASFHQEGPGNVDHIMWVTMTDEGPQMGNIALKGLFDRKGLDPSLFGAYDRKGY